MFEVSKGDSLWRDCKGGRRIQPIDGNHWPAERPLRLREGMTVNRLQPRSMPKCCVASEIQSPR